MFIIFKGAGIPPVARPAIQQRADTRVEHLTNAYGQMNITNQLPPTSGVGVPPTQPEELTTGNINQQALDKFGVRLS